MMETILTILFWYIIIGWIINLAVGKKIIP